MAYNIKGDLHVNRNLSVSGSFLSDAISGSLTTLSDGSSYLIAGSNITLSTGSNGAVTINSSGGGGGADADWTVTGSSLYTTSSLVIGQASTTSSIGSDVFLFVSGTITSGSNTDRIASFGGTVHVSGALVVGTGSIILSENRILFTDLTSSLYGKYTIKAANFSRGDEFRVKDIYLEAANVFESGSGGNVWLVGGNAGNGISEFGFAPSGGSVNFAAGSAATYSTGSTGAAGDGGGFVFYGGAGGAAITGSVNGGTGGSFSVSVGNGGSSTNATGGDGGSVLLGAGSGGAGITNGNGGYIQFTAGTANTGGTPGNIRLYAGRSFTAGFQLEDTGKIYLTHNFSPISDGGAETGNSDEFLVVSGTITTGSEVRYASFRGSIKTSGSIGFALDTYITKDGNDLKFFDTTNPGGYSLTELASGGGGSYPVSSTLYRTQIVDYATTTATSSNPESVGQVIFNPSEFAGDILLRTALANANSTTTSSVKLFNVTSGAYVVLTGASEQIDLVGITPTILTSDNLRGAAGFSAGVALYELQLFTSTGSNAAFVGGAEFRAVTSLTSSITRLNLGSYSTSTATSSNPEAVGGGYFVPTEHSPASCVFRAILSTTTGSNTAMVQLYNITSGALVHIGGAGITEISTSQTTPTNIQSVNLYSATNFDSSNASVYEVRIFGSGSSPITNLMNSEMVCS